MNLDPSSACDPGGSPCPAVTSTSVAHSPSIHQSFPPQQRWYFPDLSRERIFDLSPLLSAPTSTMSNLVRSCLKVSLSAVKQLLVLGHTNQLHMRDQGEQVGGHFVQLFKLLSRVALLVLCSCSFQGHLTPQHYALQCKLLQSPASAV